MKTAEGPRAAAMGEAQTAVSNDSYSSYWNPAGLAQLDRAELALNYQRSFQDVQEQHANLAYPLQKGAALGAYITNASVEPFSSFDASGNATGEVDASDWAYGIAYGRRMSRSLSLGGGIKFLRSKLGPATAASHAVDFGALMRFPFTSHGASGQALSIGWSAKNMGPALVYDEQPTRLPQMNQFGLGYEIFSGRDRLTTALDYNMSSDSRNYFALGQEYWIRGMVAIRAGYRFGQHEEQGMHAGLCLSVRDVQMSYSISPFGFLGDSQRLGLSYQFGPSIDSVRVPKAINSVPAPVSPPARPEPTSLSVPLSTGAALMPVIPNAAPSQSPEKKSFRPAVRRSPSVPKPDLTKMDAKNLIELGTAHLKDGNYQEATAAFGQALKREPNNKTALELMRKALNELDRQKKRQKGIYE